jgi:hypothetical protein
MDPRRQSLIQPPLNRFPLKRLAVIRLVLQPSQPLDVDPLIAQTLVKGQGPDIQHGEQPPLPEPFFALPGSETMKQLTQDTCPDPIHQDLAGHTNAGMHIA